MREQNILVVDNDKIILDSVINFLMLKGFQASGAQTLNETVTTLQEQSFSLVITDINLPDGDGFELLETIKKEYPQTVVIVITGYGSIESAVRAIKQGAYEYLTKPIADDDLLLVVERSLNQQSLMSENVNLRLQLEQTKAVDGQEIC